MRERAFALPIGARHTETRQESYHVPSNIPVRIASVTLEQIASAGLGHFLLVCLIGDLTNCRETLQWANVCGRGGGRFRSVTGNEWLSLANTQWAEKSAAT